MIVSDEIVKTSEKTALITGGTGFLGSHLLKSFLTQNYKIILLKRSFSNPIRIQEDLNDIISYDIDKIDLESIFSNHSIDLIVHCATDYGRKVVEALHVIQANLVLPLHLLQLAHKYSVPLFINTDTILDKQLNYYSLSKRQFCEWLNTFKNEMICVNIVLGHFYGPFDDVSKFATYIIQSLLSKKEIIPLTLGQQKRDFLFIDDVISAFNIIIDATKNYKPGLYSYQVGSGSRIKLRDFVEYIKELCENSETVLDFGALPYREHEVMEFNIDLQAMHDLGWTPKFSLEDGLSQTIKLEKNRVA